MNGFDFALSECLEFGNQRGNFVLGIILVLQESLPSGSAVVINNH